MRVEVFVSYAREDIAFAQQIIEELEKDGIRVWWDKKITLDSENFSEEIQEAIEVAQCFLVIWSENSNNSNWVKEEFRIASKKNLVKPKIVQASIGVPDQPFGCGGGQCKELIIENRKISTNALQELVVDIKTVIGLQGPNEHLLNPKALDKVRGVRDLAIETPVPGLDTFLSFRPCGSDGVFLLMRLDTTDGWVRSDIPSALERHKPYECDNTAEYLDGDKKFLKVKNDVYFIMDPIRAYSIQIGGLRSKRPNANPGIITGDIPKEQLKALQTSLEWVSMTLAELLSKEESLEFLWKEIEKHKDDWPEGTVQKIKLLISKNPNAPLELQRSMCSFCDEHFLKSRKLSSVDMENEHCAYIIANDFPFGPSFHYLAITKDQVHSWDKLTYKQIKGLNSIIHSFLQYKENRKGAAGITIGFNSTVRHLILGDETHSSAGASIPHIHKQVWGMAPRTANLAERLIEVSQAYWNHNVDYQKAYISALRNSGYIIWEDKYVALYVPYGQCSKHELQVMFLEPKGCYTELTPYEVHSFSKAEYIALRLFKSLEINSFNEIMLSKLYNDTRAPRFRLIVAFITREIDLAVSELSMLFVVDQHPWDSCKDIMEKWNKIKNEVCLDFECNE